MVSFLVLLCFFFFFQAEDGIRDGHVTGVQTCALPISGGSLRCVSRVIAHSCAYLAKVAWDISTANKNPARPSRNPRRRSEERRVGKECRSGCETSYYLKINTLKMTNALADCDIRD